MGANKALVIDTTAPTAAITYSILHAVKSGDSLTIATFSEPLADAPAVNIAISGANTVAATAMSKTSSTVYTYLDTVAAGDGPATVALSVGTDIAGNVITCSDLRSHIHRKQHCSDCFNSFSSYTRQGQRLKGN